MPAPAGFSSVGVYFARIRCRQPRRVNFRQVPLRGLANGC